MKTESLIGLTGATALQRAILLALTFTCLGAMASTEEKINKRFAVQPGGNVVLDVDFGSIDVRTNGSSEVTVDVWRKISRRNKSDEAQFLKDNAVMLSQDGNTVTIRSRNKAKSTISSSWSWGGANQNEAKYTITVPSQFNARLGTAGGSIDVNDLKGDVKANTSGGGLHFARLHGRLDGDTSGGSIRVLDCEGAQKVNTSGGGIEAAGGSGTFDGDTSGDSVSVKKFQGPVRVQTSGGSIAVEEVTGKIVGSTSGGSIRAVLAAPLFDNVKLETSGGSVTVRVPADAAFDLDAETSAGGVTSEFSVATTGKKDRSRLKGSVNGGGKSVWLRSSAGGIHIVRAGGLAEVESGSKLKK